MTIKRSSALLHWGADQKIELLESEQRKAGLTGWLNGLEHYHATRILPIDEDIARRWGELFTNAKRQGIRLPAIDGLIAATALRPGLHLVT
jgi:predicted nucleic acid-binding protein